MDAQPSRRRINQTRKTFCDVENSNCDCRRDPDTSSLRTSKKRPRSQANEHEMGEVNTSNKIVLGNLQERTKGAQPNARRQSRRDEQRPVESLLLFAWFHIHLLLPLFFCFCFVCRGTLHKRLAHAGAPSCLHGLFLDVCFLFKFRHSNRVSKALSFLFALVKMSRQISATVGLHAGKLQLRARGLHWVQDDSGETVDIPYGLVRSSTTLAGSVTVTQRVAEEATITFSGLVLNDHREVSQLLARAAIMSQQSANLVWEDSRLRTGDMPLLSQPFRLGFKNLGNTCFLNALLVMLCTIPDFEQALAASAQVLAQVVSQDETIRTEGLRKLLKTRGLARLQNHGVCACRRRRSFQRAFGYLPSGARRMGSALCLHDH